MLTSPPQQWNHNYKIIKNRPKNDETPKDKVDKNGILPPKTPVFFVSRMLRPNKTLALLIGFFHHCIIAIQLNPEYTDLEREIRSFPPPSNSHHQGYCIFRIGNPEPNLHFVTGILRGHTQNYSKILPFFKGLHSLQLSCSCWPRILLCQSFVTNKGKWHYLNVKWSCIRQCKEGRGFHLKKIPTWKGCILGG